MEGIAAWSEDKRNELFRETAARKNMSPAIVEKDFWVCWVLKNIFSSPQLKTHLVFKGGTSLSKVFGLIERFSEDVDLILDWRLLGYGSDQQDPYQDLPSNTQRDRFNAEFNQKAARYIIETLCPQLAEILSRCPEVHVSVDPEESQVVNIRYPAAFSLDYLRPEVRLEIGPLASYVPRSSFTIQPYAAGVFPNVFDEPDCPVVAIEAKRTFWEKATILHQQAHRPGAIPGQYSRHYYDMYRLAISEVKKRALADLSLLKNVAAFKSRFYRCSWARYEDAKPGTFKLIPPEKHVASLRTDYRQMAVMIFGEIPSFDQILDTLGQLENEINQLSPGSPQEDG